MLLQQTLNGLVLGSIYALIALGYTMVYGILELINFAHGEVYMLGAYLGIIVMALITQTVLGGLPAFILLPIVLTASMALAAAWGATIERVAYRPLRQAPRLAPLLSAVGVSIFLQNFVMVTQTAREKVMTNPLASIGIMVGYFRVSLIQLLIIAVTILFMVGLWYFIRHTRTGASMRAVAQDRHMAALCGINVDRTIMVTFLIGSSLGAAAGVMVALYWGVVNFYIGYLAGLKAFTAAVLGGIGNVPGAVLGGIFLGLCEAYGAGYLSAEYKDVYAFLLLILVLIFRPSGFLGSTVTQKV